MTRFIIILVIILNNVDNLTLNKIFSQIKCEDNINDQVQNQAPKRVKPPITTFSMDCQEDKPSILTGPQKITLYDVVKNIRQRKQKEKYQPPPKPTPK